MYDRDRLECIVGDNIRMYRKMRKLTQDALADIIEIDRAAISRYESGTNGMMGIDILLRFYQALAVTPNDLMMNDTHTDTARMYPSGTHVELIEMDDPYTDMPPGLRGTVGWVDDIATVHIFWENGSRLGALYGIDRIRKIND